MFGERRKNKRGKKKRGGQSADSLYSDSSHVPAVAGRPAGPSGDLCHVAAAKTKQKEGKKRRRQDKEREREKERDYSQRRCNGTAKEERRGMRGWRRVNSGEILLVSVNDGPWSALVSWRRRGFSRASPVSDGGGGK